MSVRRIKKNDTVIVVAGKDLGKTGKVLRMVKDGERAVVESLNIVKKATHKTEENPEGGILEKEASIAVSNLMPYCPSCKKGVRLTRTVDGDASARKCKGCGHSFE